jgi:ABC-2 type transport system ATP-binding protein
MKKTLISVENLHFAFASQTILQEVSLALEEGSFALLAGANGSGKTTLLRCLAGFYQPQRGSVALLGQDPWRHPQVLQKVGVGEEQPALPPSWTLQELAQWLEKAGSFSREKGLWFLQTLSRFRIPANLPFARLSRGEKSLAQLAYLLARQPQVLLLDEPTLGLDVVAAQQALELLFARLEEGPLTVLLATQDLELAERLVDKVVFLHLGRCLWAGPLDQLPQRFALLQGPQPNLQPPGARLLAQEPVLGGWEMVVEILHPQQFQPWLAEKGLTPRRPSLARLAAALWQR